MRNKISPILILIFLLSLTLNLLFIYYYYNPDALKIILNPNLILSLIGPLSTFMLVFLTYLYLKATKGILNENVKQSELLVSPFIYVSIEPDMEQNNFFFVKIKNSGNSTAYNIDINFSENLLSITSKSINDFYLFKRIPALNKNEEISFFLSDAKSLLNNGNTKTMVNINYSNSPNSLSKPTNNSYEIDLGIYQDLLQLTRPSNSDLFEEMRSLKEALLLNLVKNDTE